MAIYGLAMPIFIGLYVPAISLLSWFGVSDHISALICTLTVVPGSVYLSRVVCVRGWPELMKKADANAARRLGHRQ